MHKLYLATLILIFVSIANHTKINAQNNYKTTIYNAYINGDMDKWGAVIASIEKQKASTVDAKLELISYYYGYTAFLIGTKNYDSATRYLERGEQHIDAVIKYNPKNATALAYKGSFIGFKIGISKFKAIALGPESNKHVMRALEIDPQNIQAIVDYGNSLYHTPRLFGGNKKEALKLFVKAMHLFENNGQTHKNWFYLNVITLVAQTYESLNQLQKAKAQYEKILRFEPEFKWVKNNLYPTLLKKITTDRQK